MTAWLVLAAIGVLLVLLVHGRLAPVVLFPVWAGGFFLADLVDQKTFLGSFTNPALATLVLLLLVSLALERSSVMDRLSRVVIQGREALAVLRLSGFSIVFSAFLNNTAVVGAMLGMVTKQRRIPASKLLIPLSYASIVGGVITLVGTSTNLVVNSFAINAGLPALGMFQFSWVGIPAALACLLVITLTSRWLPHNDPEGAEEAQAYFLEALLTEGSSLAGRTIEENGLRRLDGLFLIEILRSGRLISPVTPDEVLVAGDVLVFSGEVQRVQSLQWFDGLKVFDNNVSELLRSNLVEVVISSESVIANQTLREVDFRTMFDAGVVGIRRGSRRLTGQLGQIVLRVGDSLLLATGPDFWQHRNIDRNFHVIGNDELRPTLTPMQGRFVIGGFAAVIALAAMEWVSLLAGLMVMLASLLITRVLTVAELRRRFPFELVLVIGSAMSVASAMESSGAADLIVVAVRWVFADYGVWGALVGVYLMTLLLTELVTNNAAAALAFPVGLSTANALGVDPTAFVMVVAYGASAGFLMPFGYQTHLMVYSPGRYRMRDFLRAGAPVSVVYSLCVLGLTPIIFPFYPVP